MIEKRADALRERYGAAKAKSEGAEFDTNAMAEAR
jgi:hypothetical protein